MVYEGRTFPTIRNAAKAMQPRIGAFDHIASFEASHFAAIVARRLRSIVAMRTDQVDALLAQAISKGIRIIAAVGDQRNAVGQRHRNVLNRLFDQIRLRAVGRGDRGPEWNPVGVGHDLELHPLAALGVANFVPPFFPRMKVASATNWSQSSLPNSASSLITAAWISSRIPSPAHSWSRRQHVDGDGRSTGTSFQRPPLRRTNKTPSKQSRSLAHGRPPLGCGGRTGKNPSCAPTKHLKRTFVTSVPWPNLLSAQLHLISVFTSRAGYETVSTSRRPELTNFSPVPL